MNVFFRYHVVQEFNKGVYDYIIATDESGAAREMDSDDEMEVEEEAEIEVDDLEKCKTVNLPICLYASHYSPTVTSTQREPVSSVTATAEEPPAKKRKRADGSPQPTIQPSKSKKGKHKKAGDKEYGVTRGVDFVDVSCVLNFDLPTSSRSYTHRVGRTARAGRTGMSLSFVVPAEEWGKNKVVGCLESARKDETVFARINEEQGARGSKIKEYNFDMKQVEAFRYRMEDALRAVTRMAIKEARIKELKMEILNSDKLKVCVSCSSAVLEPSDI